MGFALRYIAAPVLAASVAVTIAAATASAMAEPQPARTVDASTASPDTGVATVANSVALTTRYGKTPVRPLRRVLRRQYVQVGSAVPAVDQAADRR